jgi:hypothetical protein
MELCGYRLTESVMQKKYFKDDAGLRGLPKVLC